MTGADGEVTVTFLGCGDTLGSGGRLQTCIHVSTPETTFLVDCGATALPAMKARGLDPAAVETVLLTHLHGDHFGGLPFLVLDGQFSGRERPLTVAGPAGTESRVVEAMDVFFPGLSSTEQRYPRRFIEFDAGVPVDVGALTVTPYEMVHPSGAPAHALRVDVDGVRLAYSGDTEWTERLVDAAADADLFVCEAYFYERTVPYHVSYADLRKHRDRLDCDRLVLTHMHEDLLRRLDEVDAEYATDGLTLTL